jgi:hypothetical protein
MLLRLTVAAMTRWHTLTSADENDRGDSPVPTVIIWVGIAVVAIGLVAWASTYVSNFTHDAQTTPPTYKP